MRNIIFVAFICCAHALSAQEMLIEVSAGKYDRKDAVLKLQLPKPLPKGAYQLTNRKTGHVLPAQLADSVTLVFIPASPMIVGASTTYILNRSARKFSSGIT